MAKKLKKKCRESKNTCFRKWSIQLIFFRKIFRKEKKLISFVQIFHLKTLENITIQIIIFLRYCRLK